MGGRIRIFLDVTHGLYLHLAGTASGCQVVFPKNATHRPGLTCVRASDHHYLSTFPQVRELKFRTEIGSLNGTLLHLIPERVNHFVTLILRLSSSGTSCGIVAWAPVSI